MIYLVDIGNTRIKYTSLKNLKSRRNEKEFKAHESSPLSTELAVNVTPNWLTKHLGKALRIIVASVNQKDQVHMIQTWAKSSNIVCDVIDSAESAHGVTTGYSVYQQLGVDRWLALIGAYQRYQHKNIIIVDSGTATTVDMLTSKGQHLGGWIIPGVQLMQQSIILGTANVISENKVPSTQFGSLTVDNVSNGCWAATLGAIMLAKQLLHNQQNKKVFGDEKTLPVIIFSGGNGSSLLRLYKDHELNIDNSQGDKHKSATVSLYYEPDIVFYGLMEYL